MKKPKKEKIKFFNKETDSIFIIISTINTLILPAIFLLPKKEDLHLFYAGGIIYSFIFIIIYSIGRWLSLISESKEKREKKDELD
ncbi:MAG: hypothetical protein RSE93_03750 [Oscillospiraceae bacterium]